MAETKKNVYANGVFIGLSEPVRVLFNPKLAEAEKIGGKGDPKFEVQIGFRKYHPYYVPMLKEMKRIAKQKWGDDVDTSKLQLKFIDGDAEHAAILNHPEEKKRHDYAFLKGNTLMKLRSKQPISVFDARQLDNKGNPVEVTDKESIRRVIYAGGYVSLEMTFHTYDAIVDARNPQNNRPAGIAVYPEKICFAADGERLASGGKSDSSGFASVQGAVTDEDPTGESEGEDPLAGL